MEHYRYQLSGNGSGTQYTEPSTSLTDLILMGLRCTVTQSWNKMSASLAFHGLTTKSKLNITSYNLHNIHPRVILWSCKHGNINILSIGVFCRKGAENICFGSAALNNENAFANKQTNKKILLPCSYPICLWTQCIQNFKCLKIQFCWLHN